MGSERVVKTIAELIDSGHASLQTGPFGTALKAAEYSTEGVPLISVREIRNGYFELTEHTPFVNQTTLDRLPKFILRTGDIVFGRKGAVDRSAMIQESQDGWFLGSDGIRLRLDDYCDQRFVSYQVRSPLVQNWLMQHAEGTTMLSMNQKVLGRIPLTFPPLPEQKAIAHILGSLDDKIELNRRMNATLEGLAQALFQSWFVDFDPVLDNALAAGNPIPDELTDRAAVRRQALDNGTANRKAAQHFPATFQFTEELGWIPEGWEISCVGNHVSLQRGKTYKSSLKGLPGPYLLGLGAIQRNGGFKEDKLITYGGDSPDNITLEPGDIFVSLKDLTQAADLLGSVARIPPHIPSGRLTQDTVKLVFDKRPISTDYIYNSLLTPRYRTYCKDYSTGTTNLGLAREDFFSYPFAKPTDLIQSTYESFVQSTKLKHQSNTAEEKTLTNLRDTLLPQLISGELSVPVAQAQSEEFTNG